MKLLSKILPGLFGKKEPVRLLSEQEFANVYRDAASDRFPGIDFIVNDSTTITGKKGEQEHRHYLDNMYNEYKLDPAKLEEVVERFLVSHADMYIERETTLSQIIPVIKPVEYLEAIKEISIGAKQPTLPLVEKYNDELLIAYAADSENSIRYLLEEDLEEVGVSRDDLFRHATANLDRILPAVERHGDEGLYMITAGGNYEASLILLPSIWSADNFPVKGDFVIAIPNRDMLLLTGSDDPPNLEKIRQIAADSFASGSYTISPYLFRWDGNKFSRIY